LSPTDWLAIGLGAGLPLLTNEALKKIGFWKREFDLVEGVPPGGVTSMERR